jgi:hypothetical protein
VEARSLIGNNAMMSPLRRGVHMRMIPWQMNRDIPDRHKRRTRILRCTGLRSEAGGSSRWTCRILTAAPLTEADLEQQGTALSLVI